MFTLPNLMAYLRQKLGNNGSLPHESSVEGAKISSAIHPLKTKQSIEVIIFPHILVQGLGSLADTTGEAIVDECGLEHFRESGVDIHDTSSSNAIRNGRKREGYKKLPKWGMTNEWILVELPACQNRDLTHCRVKGYPTKE